MTDLQVADDVELEERIFRLLGTNMTEPEIARAIGMEPEEALPVILKVLRERGTPQLARVRELIDHVASIRFA